ncbi:Gfo/Idh/MocA family protein [Pseudochelatococcus sp. B33]
MRISKRFRRPNRSPQRHSEGEPSMQTTIRIAVAGAGAIGKAHISRIVAEPRASLSAIIGPSPQTREFAQSMGVAHFEDIEACFAHDKPDGIVLATPNKLHVPGALLAVKRGVPVLVEKPVSDDLAAAKALVEASEATGVAVLVGHHRRHSPLIRRAKQIIASGRLGRMTVVHAFCWFHKPDSGYFEGAGAWRREAGGGVILINLVHAIDDLRNLCGEIVSVQAVSSSAMRGFAVEDSAAIILRFANGALGTLSLSDTVSSPWSWEMTSGENKFYAQTDEVCYFFGGTEGSLSVPRLELWRHETAQEWGHPLLAHRVITPQDDPLVPQLRHFIDVIQRNASPIIDAQGGTKTLELTLSVVEAAKTGRMICFG